MSERFSVNLGVIVAIIIACGTIAIAERAGADTTNCPAGTQPATAADLPAMQAAGIPNPTVGMCWSASNQNVGAAAAQAKQDLQSMVCSSSVNIQGLDSNFAVCADKFMQQLRQASPGACINSAYRSVSQQLTACLGICGQSSCPGKCAPPGQSFHQRGLAIDVSYKISNQQAWQIAISSTNGGIVNPSGLHGSDPAHFQASGSSCSGAPVPVSDTTDYYTGTQTGPQNSNGTPISTQQPVTTSPFTSSPIIAAQSPLQCTAQNYCSSNTLYSLTTACTTQVLQTCQYGCVNNACALSPTATTSTSSLSTAGQSLVTDLLSPTTIATSTSLTTLSSGIIQSIQQSLGSSASPVITTIATGSTYGSVPGIGQSTFSSSFSSAVNTQPVLSPFQQLLANLHAVLISILNYFNPPSQQSSTQLSS